MTYATILKTLREKRNLTQKEVAQTCDITPEYLSKIENGTKTPSMILLKKLAGVFNIPLSVIIYLVEDNKKTKNNTEIQMLKEKMVDYLFVDNHFQIDTLRKDLQKLKTHKEDSVKKTG